MQFALSIPVKTGVEYLPLALRSIAGQSEPLEVALLDASGDARVRSLANRHAALIRYRRHTAEDAGQSAAIQEGWDRIGGDVLGWLNADDCLMPGALAAVAAAFAAHPDADVVYGHAIYVGPDWEFQTYFPSLSRDPSALRRSNVICQPACFARRVAIARVGGLDTSLRFTMDWDLWLRLFEAGCRFHFIEAPLAVVINHGATKTNTGGWARYREIDRLLRGRAGLRARLAAQIGHRRTDGAAAGGIVGRSAEIAMRASGMFRRRRRAAPVFGIEPESNRVAGRCRIPMAWYADAPPRAVRIAIAPAGPCRARCNGAALELRADGTAGAWTAQLAPSESGLYEFDIEQPGSWTLKELRLVP